MGVRRGLTAFTGGRHSRPAVSDLLLVLSRLDASRGSNPPFFSRASWYATSNAWPSVSTISTAICCSHNSRQQARATSTTTTTTMTTPLLLLFMWRVACDNYRINRNMMMMILNKQANDLYSARSSKRIRAHYCRRVHYKTCGGIKYKQVSKVIWQKAASPSCHPRGRRTMQNALTCRYVTMGRHMSPQKNPLLWGDLDHHTITSSLDPQESDSQTASQSVQPYLHSSPVCLIQTQTHRPRYVRTSVATGRIYALRTEYAA